MERTNGPRLTELEARVWEVMSQSEQSVGNKELARRLEVSRKQIGRARRSLGAKMGKKPGF